MVPSSSSSHTRSWPVMMMFSIRSSSISGCSRPIRNNALNTAVANGAAPPGVQDGCPAVTASAAAASNNSTMMERPNASCPARSRRSRSSPSRFVNNSEACDRNAATNPQSTSTGAAGAGKHRALRQVGDRVRPGGPRSAAASRHRKPPRSRRAPSSGVGVVACGGCGTRTAAMIAGSLRLSSTGAVIANLPGPGQPARRERGRRSRRGRTGPGRSRGTDRPSRGWAVSGRFRRGPGERIASPNADRPARRWGAFRERAVGRGTARPRKRRSHGRTPTSGRPSASATSRPGYGCPWPTTTTPVLVAVASVCSRRVCAHEVAAITAGRVLRVSSSVASAPNSSGVGQPSKPRRPASTSTSCPVASRSRNASSRAGHSAAGCRPGRGSGCRPAAGPGIRGCRATGAAVRRPHRPGVGPSPARSGPRRGRPVPGSSRPGCPSRRSGRPRPPAPVAASTTPAPSTVVVTPGEPEAEVSTMIATAGSLLLGVEHQGDLAGGRPRRQIGRQRRSAPARPRSSGRRWPTGAPRPRSPGSPPVCPVTSPCCPGVCTTRTASPGTIGSAGSIPDANPIPTTENPRAGTMRGGEVVGCQQAAGCQVERGPLAGHRVLLGRRDAAQGRVETDPHHHRVTRGDHLAPMNQGPDRQHLAGRAGRRPQPQTQQRARRRPWPPRPPAPPGGGAASAAQPSTVRGSGAVDGGRHGSRGIAWSLTWVARSQARGYIGGRGWAQPVVITCSSPMVIGRRVEVRVSGIVPDRPMPDQVTGHCASARTV